MARPSGESWGIMVGPTLFEFNDGRIEDSDARSVVVFQGYPGPYRGIGWPAVDEVVMLGLSGHFGSTEPILVFSPLRSAGGPTVILVRQIVLSADQDYSTQFKRTCRKLANTLLGVSRARFAICSCAFGLFGLTRADFADILVSTLIECRVSSVVFVARGNPLREGTVEPQRVFEMLHNKCIYLRDSHPEWSLADGVAGASLSGTSSGVTGVVHTVVPARTPASARTTRPASHLADTGHAGAAAAAAAHARAAAADARAASTAATAAGLGSGAPPTAVAFGSAGAAHSSADSWDYEARGQLAAPAAGAAVVGTGAAGARTVPQLQLHTATGAVRADDAPAELPTARTGMPDWMRDSGAPGAATAATAAAAVRSDPTAIAAPVSAAARGALSSPPAAAAPAAGAGAPPLPAWMNPMGEAARRPDPAQVQQVMAQQQHADDDDWGDMTAVGGALGAPRTSAGAAAATAPTWAAVAAGHGPASLPSYRARTPPQASHTRIPMGPQTLPPRLGGGAAVSAPPAHSRLVSPPLPAPAVLAPTGVGVFRLVTYNILAPSYARPDRYHYVTDPAVLDPARRLRRVLEMVAAWRADVMCMQEVEAGVFDTLHRTVGSEFEARYLQRPGKPDGLAMFVRRSKFQVQNWHEFHFNTLPRFESERPDQVVLVAQLVDIATHQRVVLATTHLAAAPQQGDLRGRQAEWCSRLLLDLTKFPVGSRTYRVLCGDFNGAPGSEAPRACEQTGLHSAYRLMYGQEPAYTFLTDSIRSTTDYIYTDLRPVNVGPLPGTTEGPLPTRSQPSDHLPLWADLMLTPV